MLEMTWRAGWILSTLCLLFSMSVAGAVYAGKTSGELDADIFSPVRQQVGQMAAAIRQSFSSDQRGEAGDAGGSSSTSEVRLEIHSTIDGSSGTTVIWPDGSMVRWVYPTLPSGASYQDAVRARDEWWESVQAQNQAFSQQSWQSLEQFRQDSQRRLEEFKLQGQQGLEDFRRDMEEKQSEFLREHGIEQ